jgi:hypothetical protein
MPKSRAADHRLAKHLAIDVDPQGVGREGSFTLDALAHVLFAFRQLLIGKLMAHLDPLGARAPRQAESRGFLPVI